MIVAVILHSTNQVSGDINDIYINNARNYNKIDKKFNHFKYYLRNIFFSFCHYLLHYGIEVCDSVAVAYLISILSYFQTVSGHTYFLTLIIVQSRTENGCHLKYIYI